MLVPTTDPVLEAPSRRAGRDTGARVTVTHAAAPLPVVVLGAPWDDASVSCRALARELARTRRVLWVSLRPRDPSPRRRFALSPWVADLVARPTNVVNDLWVSTVSADLARPAIAALRLRLAIKPFQLWVLAPEAAEHVGALGETTSLCYLPDRRAERAVTPRLLARVDAVLAATHGCAERMRRWNPASYVCLNAVDHEHMARALDDATPVPPDLAALPRPRIGVFAADEVDMRLVADLASTRPAWSVVVFDQPATELIAHATMFTSTEESRPGAYKSLDVALLAERVGDALGSSPIALRELLAAGVPVVATPTPETRRYEPLCNVAPDLETIVASIDRELGAGRGGAGLAARGARSLAMKHETWAARVAEVMRTVDDISHRKNPR